MVEHLGGAAAGDDPALVEGDEPVGDAVMSGMSCSMTSRLAPRASRMRDEQRAERLGLALGDARRRLVEQDHRRLVGEHAGQVDDAARAGGSSPTNLERNASRPSSSISSSTRWRDRRLAVHERRQAEGGVERVAHVDPALEGDQQRLLDGERREQARVLERAAEPGRRPPVGGQPVMSSPPSRTRPRVGRGEARR